MSSEVATLWGRLEAWARTHAPGMLRDLRGPANDRDLVRLERETGFALPADLRASLLLHDGESQGDYLRVWRGAGHLLSAREILECWSNLRRFAEQPDPEKAAADVADSIITVEGPVHAVAFRKGWIPILDMNGDTLWFVDLDPAPGGHRGQVIEVYLEGCKWKVLAPSYEVFLRAYVEALETGEFDARDDDGLPERSSDGVFEPGDAELTDKDEYVRLVRSFDDLPSGKRKKPKLSEEQFRRLDRLIRKVPWDKLVKLRAGTRTQVVGMVHASIGDLHQVAVAGGFFLARGTIDPDKRPIRLFRLELEIGAGRTRAVHTILSAERVDLD